VTRLAIDLRILHHARTGFFRYGQGLLQALALSPPPADMLLLRSPEQNLQELNIGGWPEVTTAAELFGDGEADALRTTVDQHAIDAVHFPFSLFPGRVAARNMLTVHDLTVIQHPETIEAPYRPSYRAAIRDAGHADLVVTDSRAVADALAQEEPAIAPVVVHPYTPFEGFGLAQVAATPASMPPGDPFVLMLGSLEPRKAPLRALAAWEQLRAQASGVLRLVVVAGHGWLENDFHAAVAASPYRDDIELRRHAIDGEVRAWMDSCSLFLAVSRYEGFGLPVLEAIYAGATVLSTACPSLIEAGVAADDLVATEEPVGEVAARAAELLSNPEIRARHTGSMLATTTGYYRSQPVDRIAAAYRTLLQQPDQPGPPS
jgi:glycosyltransferase involved in cell wall biosynthesis